MTMAATITPESVWAHRPPRARDSHKGSFGAVLAVAFFRWTPRGSE